MNSVAIYHIALLTKADEGEFVLKMAGDSIANSDALGATRVTTSRFRHQLLRRSSGLRQFDWLVSVTMMGDRDYDYAERLDRVQAVLEPWALVTGVETYREIASAE